MKVFLIILFLWVNDNFAQLNYWESDKFKHADMIYKPILLPNINYGNKDTFYIQQIVVDPKELQKIACLNSSTFFYQYKKCISKIK